MSRITPEPATGQMPRVFAPDFMCTGNCLEFEFEGRTVHGNFSIYLIKGSNKTFLVDTGHPAVWKKVESDIETFLDGRPLDYVFGTHGEFPHLGLLPNWLNKYPGCTALGMLTDYRYYYPELAHRLKVVHVGDEIDLGDRKFIFVPAIWRDLNNTLWGLETKYRTLFVSDGFASLHAHGANECDCITSERPPPDLKLARFFSEHAFQWTMHKDARQTYSDLDRLLEITRPNLIASAHSGLIDNIDDMVKFQKLGMLAGKNAVREEEFVAE